MMTSKRYQSFDGNKFGCTNDLATNRNPLSVYNNGTCVFNPASITAILKDAIVEHHTIIKEAFEDNYNGNLEVFTESEDELLEYARAIGTEVFLKSDTGLALIIPIAENYYPDVITFMPLGSNSSVEITDPNTLSVIVSCGAGNATDTQNKTAYGNGLEFWDNENYGISVDESSFSNPIIAAKLLTIKETRNCSWWEARYCARITADRNEPNRPANTIWHALNGFGKINVANAIAYNGSIIRDPFLNNGDNVYAPFVPNP